MRILRTILWVLALIGFLIFAIYNWKPVELTLWQNLVLETKLPMLVLLAFAAGFLPMWAYHLSVKWAMGRRLRSLETSLKNASVARPVDYGTPVTATGADTSVDKPGKTGGEVVDPFPSDNGGEGGARA